MAQNRNACIHCGEPINPGATKCSRCGSYQNWRRFFDVSTVILSLLVALISVVTVAIPVVRDAFEPKRADVRCRFFQYARETDEIRVLCSNRGNRTGLLLDAQLTISRNTEKQGAFALGLKQKDPTIRPGELKIFDFYLLDELGKPSALRIALTPDELCTYRAKFRFIDFRHEEPQDLPPVEAPCPSSSL